MSAVGQHQGAVPGIADIHIAAGLAFAADTPDRAFARNVGDADAALPVAHGGEIHRPDMPTCADLQTALAGIADETRRVADGLQQRASARDRDRARTGFPVADHHQVGAPDLPAVLDPQLALALPADPD